MISRPSHKTSYRRSQRGFSLAEFAIVLGIMGIVLGALWGVVAIVRENSKRATMTEQMVAMVNNIRSFYLGRARFADNNGNTNAASVTHFLLQQGIMLSDQVRSRTVGTWIVDHPWGARGASGATLANGGITADGDENSARFFRITLLGLKRSSCVDLASRLSGSNPPGLVRVDINGANAGGLPVSPDVSSGACKGTPAGTENTLAFTYTLRIQG